MVTAYTVNPLARPPDTSISIPGSKSLTNRALIMAVLADGDSVLHGVLDSQDTRVMIESLRRLGFAIDGAVRNGELRVKGQGGEIPASGADLFLENSGTSIRFLTALCSLGKGRYRLDGSERMRQRPQADLLDALTQSGISAWSELDNGRPPLIVEDGVNGYRRLRGGEISVGVDASSQFLTALLMVAPYWPETVTLNVRGTLRPFYVDITARMMEQWGVNVTTGIAAPLPPNHGGVDVRSTSATGIQYSVAAGQRYVAQACYEIEPDASSASYFFAAAALSGGRITVSGLSENSLQGDVRFATEVLAEMGCSVSCGADGISVCGPAGGRLRGVNRDMSAISDTSLTLAALAPFADTPTTVTNIAHTRDQECDRIAAVCTEMKKLGVRVEERRDGWRIYPTESIRPGSVATYSDHRVAMSFALVGLRVPGIVIQDPDCVQKTFPEYWQHLKALA